MSATFAELLKYAGPLGPSLVVVLMVAAGVYFYDKQTRGREDKLRAELETRGNEREQRHAAEITELKVEVAELRTQVADLRDELTSERRLRAEARLVFRDIRLTTNESSVKSLAEKGEELLRK